MNRTVLDLLLCLKMKKFCASGLISLCEFTFYIGRPNKSASVTPCGSVFALDFPFEILTLLVT